MAIRLYRAYTPGTRNRSVSNFEELIGQEPYKRSTRKNLPRNGRNNRGIVTSRGRGGAHKRLYRIIDFRRNKKDIVGKVVSVEYDPNRNAYISLISYADGERRYVLHAWGVKVGDVLTSGYEASVSNGNASPLTKIPLGTAIHNVEVIAGRGGQLVRAAGTAAKTVAKEGWLATLRLPSGEVRLVSQNCLATVGRVGNIDINKKGLGKAGSRRRLGERPTVRGTAMNPVDHPHGGGEGRTPIGREKPSTPWGHAALGRRSRKIKRYSNPLILRRRKSH
uniref:Large ribosomal subunit protein uL2c n=1 Tax=Schizaea pectinata TaxID=148576 RepID=A0A286QHI0_9MONI|nr:ribosomal protein L2 [Schizaea pectinata]APT66061.1 ribosomal protein L2 [Schizaea pectinata]